MTQPFPRPRKMSSPTFNIFQLATDLWEFSCSEMTTSSTNIIFFVLQEELQLFSIFQTSSNLLIQSYSL